MRPDTQLVGRWFLGVMLAAALYGAPAAAQVPDSLKVDTLQAPDSLQVDTLAAADTIPGEEVEGSDGISPGGAFLRSALIPGWGHAEVGSYVRGAFYFTFESLVSFMLFKTQSRIGVAEERNLLVEEAATARLLAAGTDPVGLEEVLGEEEDVEESRGLVEARKGQREDWLALGLFLLFLGGADAYVAAHLSEIPAAVEIQGDPTGRMEIGVSIPVGLPHF